MTEDLLDFIKTFDIADNALDMRTLVRWNGRDLRNRENLAEHTHLVVACAIQLYDEFKVHFNKELNFERVIRHCMLHDSLELLRGDILSITKDTVPGLRQFTDEEEEEFIDCILEPVNRVESKIIKLADLMACYRYIERELKYPSNDYAVNSYVSTKNKFDDAYDKFCKEYGIELRDVESVVSTRFKKGYEADAGVDVILDKDIVILPMSTMSINLNITVTPKEGEMAVLCARTSAAARGICVAMCPIDANYTGNVTAIVHNVSNEIIVYKKGEAFCQVVGLPITQPIPNVEVKKPGRRTGGKLGSTGI